VTRVLVVDDEPQLRRALDVNLAARGYDVETAQTGEAAIELAARTAPDLVLLDVGLPGMDGLAVIRRLREWSNMPIVIVSVRDGEETKMEALDAGADDYITKPFGVDELLARVRAALRRHHCACDEVVIRTADFTLDLAAGDAWRMDEEVHLTPTEWKLVRHLVRSPGRLVTRRFLLRQVWDPEHETQTSYLRVYFASLRRKLEPNPAQPRYFITEAGIGYRFQPGPPSA
jgi:two-component system KDP operon response regulator KdpE